MNPRAIGAAIAYLQSGSYATERKPFDPVYIPLFHKGDLTEAQLAEVEAGYKDPRSVSVDDLKVELLKL